MISAKKKNFIVEFRPSTIRAARISSESSPTVIEEVGEWNWSEGSIPATEVREFASAKANGFLKAACAVYPKDRLLKKLLVDSPRGKEVDFVLGHLKESVGVDPDDFSVFCLSAESGNEVDLSSVNKKDILLCGSARETVEDMQRRMIDCAIYPRRLEMGTIGTVGALKNAIGNEAGRSPVLFLEIDTDFTTAVIVGPKGVEMARKIDCGSKAIALALKEEMNLKDEAAAEKILESQAFDLGPMAPKLLRKLLRELQSSIGFFEVQTGNSVSELFCLKEGESIEWLEASICDLLNLTPLNLDFPVWLEKNGVTFSGEAVAQKLDTRWIGLMALVLELNGGGSDS